jgi:hypothetical protein
MNAYPATNVQRPKDGLCTFVVIAISLISPIFANNIPCTWKFENSADSEKLKVYECWKAYLQSAPDSLYDNPYWNSDDKQKYRSYDLLNSEGYLTPGLYKFRGIRNEVLSISKIEDKYDIRSMFYWIYKDTLSNSYNIYVMAITHTMAQIDSTGQCKLSNFLHHYTINWKTERYGNIAYFYYPEYNFNKAEASRANRMLAFLRENLDIQVDDIKYYISENCENISKLKGFDYVVGEGENPTNECGFFDVYNNIIYATAKRGECYEHEFMRLVWQQYPQAHGLFIQGVTECFVQNGSQRGILHQEHFNNIDEYLILHPEIDFYEWRNLPNLKGVTAPIYLIGAMICMLTIEKGGIPLLAKAIKEYGNTKEQLYLFIQTELGIREEDFNRYFRQKVHEYAIEGFPNYVLE